MKSTKDNNIVMHKNDNGNKNSKDHFIVVNAKQRVIMTPKHLLASALQHKTVDSKTTNHHYQQLVVVSGVLLVASETLSFQGPAMAREQRSHW